MTSTAQTRIKEAKRLARVKILSGLHPSELIGRKFNKIIQMLPLKDRGEFKCCFYCGDQLEIDTFSNDHIYPDKHGRQDQSTRLPDM